MADKKDISFVNQEFGVKFNFRVAGIFTCNDKILLQKSDKDEYYSLIGGRVNYFEDTKDALIRECEEEIGIKLDKNDLKLIDVVENFFIYNETKFHELLYIYKIENNTELLNKDNFKTLDKDECINKWFSKDDIKNMNIMPKIVKEIFNNDQILHHIIRDY